MNKLLSAVLLTCVLIAPAGIAACGGAEPGQEAQLRPVPVPTDKPPSPQPIPNPPRPGPTDTGDPGPEKAPPPAMR